MNISCADAASEEGNWASKRNPRSRASGFVASLSTPRPHPLVLNRSTTQPLALNPRPYPSPSTDPQPND